MNLSPKDAKILAKALAEYSNYHQDELTNADWTYMTTLIGMLNDHASPSRPYSPVMPGTTEPDF